MSMISSSPRVPGRRGDLTSMYREQARGGGGAVGQAVQGAMARAPQQWAPEAGIPNTASVQPPMTRGPENIAYGQNMPQMDPTQLLRMKAEQAMRQQQGGFTDPGMNQPIWNEAAPGARPQQPDEAGWQNAKAQAVAEYRRTGNWVQPPSLDQWMRGGSSLPHPSAGYDQHTSPGWNPNGGGQPQQMPDQAALAAAYAQAIANGGYGNRGPENAPYGAQQARPQSRIDMVRERAAAAQAPQYQSPGWNPNGGAPGGQYQDPGMGQPVWQESAPGARPQQRPMQQAPQMTTTSVYQPQQQAPQQAAAPMNNKMSGWSQTQQSMGQPQGTTTYSDPNDTRMQAVNSQYNQMQREPSHTGMNPYASAQNPRRMANMFQNLAGQIPRYAYGTDNSQAYANQGMGGAWIPTSNNQHAAGMELPPALQALVNAGVPITPALLNSVTGQANGQVNMGAAYNGLGGGTLASLQGINNMTSGERENWGGFVSGPLGMREADTIEAIGRPTAGLQSAQRART